MDTRRSMVKWLASLSVMGAAVLCHPSLVVAQSGGTAAGIIPQPKMGDPLLGLNGGQLNQFLIGKVAFARVLQVEEGRGPIFNQDSCASCHNNPIGGSGSQTVTRFGTIDGTGNFDPLAELGGSLLQHFAISDECAEQIPPEATITAERLTPSTLGFGLTEAIPDADLLALQDNPPVNPTSGLQEVSGIARMVEAFEDPGVLRVGRFGWKSGVPTVLTFSADASLNEMGLTNRFVTEENDPNGINPPDLADCDPVPDDPYEDNVSLGNGVDKEFIDVVTDFQRFLAPPPQTPKSGMTGETLFMTIGCGDCHIPTFTTADDPSLEDAIRNKVIHPYSDYLLHDMARAADFIVDGAAGAQEIRTIPLRGVRARGLMWHDGRAAGGFFEDRITQVVACHCALDSEGQPSAQRFLSGTVANCPDSVTVPGSGFTCDPGSVKGGLDDDQRAAVIAFLASLGRREFDHDGDDEITLTDFVTFASCFGGGPYTPDDPCAISDVDQNGEVNFVDYAIFLSVYTGPQDDCNSNAVLDLLDILNGTSPDANANGVPDECECLADLDGDGSVGILDLLMLLAAWNADPGGPPDFDGDGNVGILDLLVLLSNWGPCS